MIGVIKRANTEATLVKRKVWDHWNLFNCRPHLIFSYDWQSSWWPLAQLMATPSWSLQPLASTHECLPSIYGQTNKNARRANTTPLHFNWKVHSMEKPQTHSVPSTLSTNLPIFPKNKWVGKKVNSAEVKERSAPNRKEELAENCFSERCIKQSEQLLARCSRLSAFVALKNNSMQRSQSVLVERC